MRFSRLDISVVLRLLSAAWGVAIVILVAAAFGEHRDTALAQFFYISLIAFSTSGFSSFTLSRYAQSEKSWIMLAGIVPSSIAIFLVLELTLVPGPVPQAHAWIAVFFVLREVMSYWARSHGRYDVSVIIRDHLWRAIFSAGLFLRMLGVFAVSIQYLLVAATAISFFLEVGAIFVLWRNAPGLNVQSGEQATAVLIISLASILTVAAYDLIGKLQSLSIAATAIFITSNEGQFETALVTAFVLVERSSRPLGLIASQAILDFQRQGSNSHNLKSYIRGFLTNRRKHFIGGISLFVVVLAVLLAIYGSAVSFGILAVMILFHAYIPVFNITNSYILLNKGWSVILARTLITLTVVGALMLHMETGIAILLAGVVVSMITQDMLLVLWEMR